MGRTALVAAAALVAAVGVASTASDQQATFRATVDLVAVDVQVVDRNGRPIPDLGAEKFEVSIDGRRRRVVSADFVRHADLGGSRDLTTIMAAHAAAAGGPTASTGRVFMIAVDVNSFSVGDSRGVVAAAAGFIKALRPDDQVGIYAFPIGAKIAPSTDHYAAARRLDTIVGAKHTTESDYNLSPSEVVDITAETAASNASLGRAAQANASLTSPDTGTLRRVMLRECGGVTDTACAANIRLDAEAMAFFFEGQVTQAMSGLGSLIRDLSAMPGRKTVVVLSGGMTASDRPGGRPNMDDFAKTLGRTAAESNTSVYALHIDTSAVTAYSAERQRSNKSPVSREREAVMLGRLLDMFSGASGGTMMRVLVGSGEGALERVLRETSSHYLLGVEPADSDRGRLRELKVKVTERGVTVRSRLWVSVPKKPLS